MTYVTTAGRYTRERVVGGIALMLAFLMLAAITGGVIGFGAVIIKSAIVSGKDRAREMAACEHRGGKGTFVPVGLHPQVPAALVDCRDAGGNKI